MNRWFPRSARKALFGGGAVLAALALAGCTPDNSVKPGAPVLTQFLILQAGMSPTTITGTTPECTVGLASGAACFPQGQSTGDDGGTTPPDTLCHLAASDDWCTCTADAMDMTMGTWGCTPFTAVAGVIAIFDRVISTAPFDMADGGPSAAVATLTGGAAPTMPTLLGDYASTGSPNGGVFQIYGQYVLSNFRFSGPSILLSADPAALPSGSKLTISLDRNMVTAKDGHTSFTGEGLLTDGSVSFKTADFIAVIARPPAAPGPDGGPAPTQDSPSLPDNMPATVSFTNFVDVAAIAPHIEVLTGGGSVVPVDIASMDKVNVTLTPKTTWPASATIKITVDASAADLLGETLGTPVTKTFTTTAM